MYGTFNNTYVHGCDINYTLNIHMHGTLKIHHVFNITYTLCM